jgi:hypothetical protein
MPRPPRPRGARSASSTRHTPRAREESARPQPWVWKQLPREVCLEERWGLGFVANEFQSGSGDLAKSLLPGLGFDCGPVASPSRQSLGVDRLDDWGRPVERRLSLRGSASSSGRTAGLAQTRQPGSPLLRRLGPPTNGGRTSDARHSGCAGPSTPRVLPSCSHPRNSLTGRPLSSRMGSPSAATWSGPYLGPFGRVVVVVRFGPTTENDRGLNGAVGFATGDETVPGALATP